MAFCTNCGTIIHDADIELHKCKRKPDKGKEFILKFDEVIRDV